MANRFQLDRVADDIGEARDVAEQHPNELREMSAVMKRFHAEVKADSDLKRGGP